MRANGAAHEAAEHDDVQVVRRILLPYTCGMASLPEELSACTGFVWDEGNVDKNWDRHGVSTSESEQAFFQRPILIAPDTAHSELEARFAALGRTIEGRRFTIVFTIRDTRIRVISARDMSRRERRMYERA